MASHYRKSGPTQPTAAACLAGHARRTGRQLKRDRRICDLIHFTARNSFCGDPDEPIRGAPFPARGEMQPLRGPDARSRRGLEGAYSEGIRDSDEPPTTSARNADSHHAQRKISSFSSPPAVGLVDALTIASSVSLPWALVSPHLQ